LKGGCLTTLSFACKRQQLTIASSKIPKFFIVSFF
jgi:hypothetical protein